MNKLGWIIIVCIGVALASAYYFLRTNSMEQKNITWGVNFSQMQAEALQLNWKEMYLAMLRDLGVKKVKLVTQWDWVEGKQDDFYFQDIDWQIAQAEHYGTQLIYVVGMKTGRWPECHLPTWAVGLSKEEQQKKLLEYVEVMVRRYKGSPAVAFWQVEHEPLFKFGECPWYDKEFLKKEVALVKTLDPSRQIIISDTGEASLWFEAANIGDIVSATMYRTVWMHISKNLGFFFKWPLPPQFYGAKAMLIKKVFNKPVICGELQAEPWVSRVFNEVPLEEQEKSMNLDLFKTNITYAKKTGLGEFYFWGVEWWYWLKEKQHKPDIWNEAKKLF